MSTGTGINIAYDGERKVIVVEIPYDAMSETDLELSSSGKTYTVVNEKVNATLDTGLNVPEHFFIPVAAYRYVNAPRRREVSNFDRKVVGGQGGRW